MCGSWANTGALPHDGIGLALALCPTADWEGANSEGRKKLVEAASPADFDGLQNIMQNVYSILYSGNKFTKFPFVKLKIYFQSQILLF
jgi:hypothetical protein